MGITKADIKRLASDRSHDRGEEIYEDDNVSNVEKRSNILSAQVYGSHHEPYQVKVELDGDKIISTHCTCPYDWGGICKHTVATLLYYIQKPDQVMVRASMEELLKGLNETDLRHILINLLKSNPHLSDSVEIAIAGLKATEHQKPSPRKGKETASMEPQPDTVDTSVFKRKAKLIIKNVNWEDHYYDYGYDDDGLWLAVEDFTKLLDEIGPWLDKGDGGNALRLLDTVTDTFISWWAELDDSYMDPDEFFDKVNVMLAEAFLSAPLSQKEKTGWEKKLHEWEEILSGMGFDFPFTESLVTLLHGWEYPSLQDVLKGETSGKIYWKFGEEDYDPGDDSGDDDLEDEVDDEYPVESALDLTTVYLNVLERQERTQEFLNLAKVQEEPLRYVSMLMKFDRNHEAEAYALEHFKTAAEAEHIAKILHDKGMKKPALDMAAHGLSLPGRKYHLARWLRDKAAENQLDDLALNAAKIAFSETFAFDDYLVLKHLAGAEWHTLKSDLLLYPNAHIWGNDIIKIYLNEGMLKEAMAFVDKNGTFSSSYIKEVVDAVYEKFPDWAIEQCKKQGEPNMDQGKSKYYEHSVRWVERPGKAYLSAGRQQEWHDYLEGLIKKHSRKYSLRPRLEALRALSG